MPSFFYPPVQAGSGFNDLILEQMNRMEEFFVRGNSWGVWVQFLNANGGIIQLSIIFGVCLKCGLSFHDPKDGFSESEEHIL